jgi:hypothetical protein
LVLQIGLSSLSRYILFCIECHYDFTCLQHHFLIFFLITRIYNGSNILFLCYTQPFLTTFTITSKQPITCVQCKSRCNAMHHERWAWNRISIMLENKLKNVEAILLLRFRTFTSSIVNIKQPSRSVIAEVCIE